MGSISLYLVGNLKAWACVWGLLRVSFSGLYLRCLGFRQDLGLICTDAGHRVCWDRKSDGCEEVQHLARLPWFWAHVSALLMYLSYLDRKIMLRLRGYSQANR